TIRFRIVGSVQNVTTASALSCRTICRRGRTPRSKAVNSGVVVIVESCHKLGDFSREKGAVKHSPGQFRRHGPWITPPTAPWPLASPWCQSLRRTSRRARPTVCVLRVACPAVAIAGSSSSPLAIPRTSHFDRGRYRWLSENTLRLPVGRRTSNFVLRTVLAPAPPSADTALLRSNLPRSSPLRPSPQRVNLSLPLPVLPSHMLRPARLDTAAVLLLSL